MKDITVVVPVHEINESIKKYLTNSIQSIANQSVKPEKVCVVHADTKELNEFFNSWEKPTDLNVNILANKNKTDFCSQINLDHIDIKG